MHSLGKTVVRPSGVLAAVRFVWPKGWLTGKHYCFLSKLTLDYQYLATTCPPRLPSTRLPRPLSHSEETHEQDRLTQLSATFAPSAREWPGRQKLNIDLLFHPMGKTKFPPASSEFYLITFSLYFHYSAKISKIFVPPRRTPLASWPVSMTK